MPFLPPLSGSEEEREHAELLMDYQTQRGGRVQLKSIMMPEVEFDHPEKVGLVAGGEVDHSGVGGAHGG